jgi:DNA-binding protein YbaB
MVGDPGAELSAVESMVADWERGGQERLARVAEVTERVGRLSATSRSADGAVTVSVDSRGLVTDIRLAEAAASVPVVELSALIMRTLQAAQAQLPGLMAEVAQECGMAGDGVVSHLLEQAESSFPAPPEPEPEPGGGPVRRRGDDDEYFDEPTLSRDEWRGGSRG